MKYTRFIAAIMFFVAAFAVSSSAQTATAANSGMKVAIIESAAFGDEKLGITKYISAMKALNTQFDPRRKELEALQAKIQAEVSNFEKLSKPSPGVPLNEASLVAKREAIVAMETDFKRKSEDAQAAYQAALGRTMQPIFADIGKAIQDYSKQKGFGMVLDASKDQTGLILYIDQQAADVTADFVKFYNARPAGSAAAK